MMELSQKGRLVALVAFKPMVPFFVKAEVPDWQEERRIRRSKPVRRLSVLHLFFPYDPVKSLSVLDLKARTHKDQQTIWRPMEMNY
jgi:hypothetical protein